MAVFVLGISVLIVAAIAIWMGLKLSSRMPIEHLKSQTSVEEASRILRYSFIVMSVVGTLAVTLLLGKIWVGVFASLMVLIAGGLASWLSHRIWPNNE